MNLTGGRTDHIFISQARKYRTYLHPANISRDGASAGVCFCAQRRVYRHLKRALTAVLLTNACLIRSSGARSMTPPLLRRRSEKTYLRNKINDLRVNSAHSGGVRRGCAPSAQHKVRTNLDAARTLT